MSKHLVMVDHTVAQTHKKRYQYKRVLKMRKTKLNWFFEKHASCVFCLLVLGLVVLAEILSAGRSGTCWCRSVGLGVVGFGCGRLFGVMAHLQIILTSCGSCLGFKDAACCRLLGTHVLRELRFSRLSVGYFDIFWSLYCYCIA